jgi:hypothetical protein
MNNLQFNCLLRLLAIAAISAGISVRPAPAAPISVAIEPDSYADAQILNGVSAFVTLSTAVPPSNAPTFDVVAYTDPAGASTGAKVFAHAGGIPFWSTIRMLRMDFSARVTSISLDYTASGFQSNTYAGRLEAYSSAGVLVASDNTALLAGGQHETMNVTAPQIAYALAYPPADPFGDLDNLHFTAVPEPATCLLSLIGLLGASAHRRRNTSQQGPCANEFT